MKKINTQINKTIKPDIEIEYKFQIVDLRTLKALLSKKFTKKKLHQYQSNVIFDNPMRLMQKTDGRIRVRTKGQSGLKTLTYKKPLAPINGAKREIEHEIDFVDTTNQIEKILAAMDFVPTTSYERYQSEWQSEGVHLTIDEYPYANFLEIEGEEKKIGKIAKILNFNIKNALIQPADTLFQKWRKERGLPFKPHMKFDDYCN